MSSFRKSWCTPWEWRSCPKIVCGRGRCYVLLRHVCGCSVKLRIEKKPEDTSGSSFQSVFFSMLVSKLSAPQRAPGANSELARPGWSLLPHHEIPYSEFSHSRAYKLRNGRGNLKVRRFIPFTVQFHWLYLLPTYDRTWLPQSKFSRLEIFVNATHNALDGSHPYLVPALWQLRWRWYWGSVDMMVPQDIQSALF